MENFPIPIARSKTASREAGIRAPPIDHILEETRDHLLQKLCRSRRSWRLQPWRALTVAPCECKKESPQEMAKERPKSKKGAMANGVD